MTSQEAEIFNSHLSALNSAAHNLFDDLVTGEPIVPSRYYHFQSLVDALRERVSESVAREAKSKARLDK